MQSSPQGPEPQISLVIPLYNEEEVFQKLVERLTHVMDAASLPIETILVDDGSRDKTPNLMRELAMRDRRFVAISLSRNFGHQLAVSAGLANANGSAAVMILDGDLQDPPELWKSFYEKIQEGFDVVYAIRHKRKEGFLLKTAYWIYYRLMSRFASIEIPIDSGDFCMVSRRVANLLSGFPEESRYLRGMRAWVGFKQTGFPYSRDERQAGHSKYTLKKLIQLAYMGFFNFTEVPIKMIKRVGYCGILLSIFYLGYCLALKFSRGNVPQGFSAILFTIIMFGSIQVLSVGLVGEYLLRVFFQVKGRPLFLVDWVVRDSTFGKCEYIEANQAGRIAWPGSSTLSNRSQSLRK